MRPSVLCDATAIEGCEPVKQFDVKKLYKDSPEVSGRLRVHAKLPRVSVSAF